MIIFGNCLLELFTVLIVETFRSVFFFSQKVCPVKLFVTIVRNITLFLRSDLPPTRWRY